MSVDCLATLAATEKYIDIFLVELFPYSVHIAKDLCVCVWPCAAANTRITLAWNEREKRKYMFCHVGGESSQICLRSVLWVFILY